MAKLVAGLLLLGLSVALVVAYQVVGVHVDTEGFLHEPFALIPLAWLSGSNRRRSDRDRCVASVIRHRDGATG